MSITFSLLLVFLLAFEHFVTLRSLWSMQEEKIDGSLEFLILASDGLWDVVSNEV